MHKAAAPSQQQTRRPPAATAAGIARPYDPCPCCRRAVALFGFRVCVFDSFYLAHSSDVLSGVHAAAPAHSLTRALWSSRLPLCGTAVGNLMPLF